MSTDDGRRLLDEIRVLREQRDELASALREVIGWVPCGHWHTTAPLMAVERARTILAEVAR